MAISRVVNAGWTFKSVANHSIGLSFGVLSSNRDDFLNHAGILVAIAISCSPPSPRIAKRSRAATTEKVAFSINSAGWAMLLEFRMVSRICWLSVCLVALVCTSPIASAQSANAASVPASDIILVWNQVMLAERSNDNSNLSLPYNYSTLPGYHQPDPLHPNQELMRESPSPTKSTIRC